jgi:iron complex transport system permease protein
MKVILNMIIIIPVCIGGVKGLAINAGFEEFMKKRYLILLLVVLSVLSLFVGVMDISLDNLMAMEQRNINIMLLSRLPRLISIITAGVGMSIAGLIMQQISRNKFVSPTTAATVDSARLGILVSLLLFTSANTMTKLIICFVSALAGTFLFMRILRAIKFKNVVFIPLIGIMLGGIIDSVTTFFAYKYDLVQNINSWLQGDFSMIIKGRYELLYLSIPLVIAAYLYANQFTLVGMGEDFSTSLGLNYKRFANLGLCITAMITSLVLVTVGRIPFLGLIIPNIVTIYQGDNLRRNIPVTALAGALFLLACDILGRTIIYPYEISIGLIVGVLGSVIFLYLLLRRYDK